jgi:hypothetical protein
VKYLRITIKHVCFMCTGFEIIVFLGMLDLIVYVFHFSKESMMKSLIAPYESRSWAQTNWILVRIWKVSVNLFYFLFCNLQ